MVERARSFRRSSNVASRTVEGRAVVIVMGGETLHSLNGTGTWLWDACCSSGPFDIDGLAERLAQRFSVDRESAERDVSEFLDMLQRVGAIVEVS